MICSIVSRSKYINLPDTAPSVNDTKDRSNHACWQSNILCASQQISGKAYLGFHHRNALQITIHGLTQM